MMHLNIITVTHPKDRTVISIPGLLNKLTPFFSRVPMHSRVINFVMFQDTISE